MALVRSANRDRGNEHVITKHRTKAKWLMTMRPTARHALMRDCTPFAYKLHISRHEYARASPRHPLHHAETSLATNDITQKCGTKYAHDNHKILNRYNNGHTTLCDNPPYTTRHTRHTRHTRATSHEPRATSHEPRAHSQRSTVNGQRLLPGLLAC